MKYDELDKNDVNIDYRSKKYFVGANFKTNEGLFVEVIGKSVSNNRKYYVEFQNYDYVCLQRDGRIHMAECPFYKNIAKTGYIGVGKHSSNTNKYIYDIWRSMIERCYGENEKKHIVYKGKVIVSSEWHNFQNFAEWCCENLVYGYDLDKDILSYINNSSEIYSKGSCIFIPHDLNIKVPSVINLLIGKVSGYTIEKRSKVNPYVIVTAVDGKKVNIGAYKTRCLARRAFAKNKIDELESYIRESELSVKIEDCLNKIIYDLKEINTEPC